MREIIFLAHLQTQTQDPFDVSIIGLEYKPAF